MNVQFRITINLMQRIRTDLMRPHPFAHERVGFVAARAASLGDGGVGLFAYDYLVIDDGQYVDKPDVGAYIGSDALRSAMQFAYRAKCSMAHIHLHHHAGKTWFSPYDLKENRKFVPDFFNVCPKVPHAAIVLSLDSATGVCWLTKSIPPLLIDEFIEVGAPQQIHYR